MNKDIQNELKNILENRKKALAEVDAKIREAEEAAQAAATAREAATINGDLPSFRKAQAEAAEAEDALKMYSARKKMLEAGHLISEEEYNQTITAILAEMAALSEEAKKKIRPLADQMWTISEELAAAFAEKNKLLQFLQRNIWQEEPKTFNSALENRFNDYSVIGFVRFALNSPRGETITGKKYQETGVNMVTWRH